MNYSVRYKEKAVKVECERVCPPPYNNISYMEFINIDQDGERLYIHSEREISSVCVRPKNRCTYEITDLHNAVVTPVEKGHFTVEINGLIENVLAVFVNPKRETEKRNRRVIHFKSDEYIGCLKITGESVEVIIDDGVNITGKIELENCTDSVIGGRGSINGRPFIKGQSENCFARCIKIVDCKNILLRDITVRDSHNWSVSCHNCENVTIDNVKIIGSRGNSDGIDVCGSRHIEVKNCFTRVWDDSLVVKGFDTGDVFDIKFKNCVLWNDFARPMEIGVELRCNRVSDIEFSNIDVIHSLTGYPIMGIHHGDRANVENISFGNIRIEDAPGAQLFDIRITDSKWNTDDKKGHIKDVLLKDIYCNESNNFPLENSRIEGYSETGYIENVKIENVVIGKNNCFLSEGDVDVYDNVKNVSILPATKENVKISNAVKGIEQCKNGHYTAEIETTVKNTGKSDLTLPLITTVSPAFSAEKTEKTVCVKGGETIKVNSEFTLQPGKYAIRTFCKAAHVSAKPVLADLKLDLRSGKTAELRFYNYYGEQLYKIVLKRSGNEIIFDGSCVKFYNSTVYSARKYREEIGTVAFTCEETDFGEAPALVKGRGGYICAPQLRCPAEITMVFKNQPKVEKITENTFSPNGERQAITLDKLDVKESDTEFLLEIVIKDPFCPQRRYPFSLFHSADPENSAHMFATVCI